MGRYNYYIIALAALMFSSTAWSQNGRVNVSQDEEISRLLDLYSNVNSKTKYFTVQVGFGSYTWAAHLKTQVDTDFPGLSSRIIFDSPTYRVHVGRFKTKLEAERKFQEIRKKYPASLLLKPD